MEEVLIGLINISLLFYLISVSHLMPKKTKIEQTAPNINIIELREAILR
ncbi:MAG: hypothetical protein ABIG84_02015 [archaeon]